MDTATATAAPVEIEIGGKRYWMTPLVDRDYGELDRWIRARTVAMARDSLSDRPTVGEVKLTMDEAFRSALGMSCLEEPRLLAGAEGFARVVWQMLRAKHPNVAFETIVAAFRNHPEDSVRAEDAIRLLRGATKESEAGGSDAANPTAAASSAT